MHDVFKDLCIYGKKNKVSSGLIANLTGFVTLECSGAALGRNKNSYKPYKVTSREIKLRKKNKRVKNDWFRFVLIRFSTLLEPKSLPGMPVLHLPASTGLMEGIRQHVTNHQVTGWRWCWVQSRVAVGPSFIVFGETWLRIEPATLAESWLAAAGWYWMCVCVCMR